MHVTKVRLNGSSSGFLGRADFSDGKSYEFCRAADGFEFVTDPAYGTHRTRVFESPKRSDALVAWFEERLKSR